ncbi:14754_t:CDS:2, partial [Racocetra persica]
MIGKPNLNSEYKPKRKELEILYACPFCPPNTRLNFPDFLMEHNFDWSAIKNDEGKIIRITRSFWQCKQSKDELARKDIGIVRYNDGAFAEKMTREVGRRNVWLREDEAKIQQLIGKATEDNNHQKQILSFLFAKLAEVKELETIERLKNYPKFLNAYL